MDCWQRLGIAETADKREIKRAYAKLLKENNPEDRPAEFQAIREAYEQALQIAQYLQEDGDRRAPPASHPSLALDQVTSHPTTEEPPPRLREKEQILGVQVERIDAALADVIQLSRQNEPAAIELCKITLKEDFYQALDVRYEFEGRLIRTLLENDLATFAFLTFMHQEFRWDIDIFRAGRIAIGHFDSDARFSGAFYAAVRPYLTELIKRALRDELQSPHRSLSPEQLDELESLLFSEGRESELAEYCRQRKNVALIQAAFAFLIAKQFVTPQYSFLPHKTLRWLIDNKIVQPTAPKAQTASPPQSAPEEDSKFPRWLIWIAVVIFIRILAFVGTDHSTTQPTRTPSNFDRSTSAGEQGDSTALLERDAAAGRKEAQFALGLRYLNGSLAKREPKKGLEWLERAANQEYAPAQEIVGILYYTGEAGVQDYKKAVEQLTSASVHDRGDATFWLSRAFEDGRGTDRDEAKARRLLDRAVELGSSEAMRVKGLKFIYGHGEEQSSARGVEYLRDAIRGGNRSASYQLAQEYLSGKRLKLSYDEAFTLLNAASLQQTPIAQFWLSQLYQKGLGVPSDSKHARQLIDTTKQRAAPDVVNDFASQLVTHANKQLRNSELAIELMENLLANPSNSSAARLNTLASAYAETGQFDKAFHTEHNALDALRVDTTGRERQEYQSRVALYKAKSGERSNPVQPAANPSQTSPSFESPKIHLLDADISVELEQGLTGCSSPDFPPAIPDGATATRAEMVSAQAAFQNANGATTEYVNCLDSLSKVLFAKYSGHITGKKATEVNRQFAQLHNSAVEAATKYSDGLNQEIRAFNERIKSGPSSR
jgi:TPR repeat protein